VKRFNWVGEERLELTQIAKEHNFEEGFGNPAKDAID
jgi:hypothetical protein